MSQGIPHVAPEALNMAPGTRHVQLESPNMAPGPLIPNNNPKICHQELLMEGETPHMNP